MIHFTRTGRPHFASIVSDGALWASRPFLLAEATPLIKRLDNATRAKVLAALAGLVILGFAMVLLTWLAARVVQRYRHGSAVFQPTMRPEESDWTRKRLPGSEAEEGEH